MANWDAVVNNRMSMGRSRSLCLALNAVKRRREAKEEERRPAVNPFLGRGIVPIVPRFRHWDGVPGRGGNNTFRGRSRLFREPHRVLLGPSPIPNPAVWDTDPKFDQ